MNVPSYEQLLAENERLREEGRKDYEGMREFQQKYIAADQELRKLRAELDALLAWKEEAERQEPKAWMLECQTLGGDTGWILSWTQSGAGLCDRLKGEEHEKPLYARPVSAQSVPDGVMRERVMEAIAEALGDGAYDCTRVWSAWGYGTMGSDDFRLIANDPARLDEIAEAAIQAVFAAAPKPEETK